MHAEEHCEIWNLNWNSKVTIDDPFIEVAEVTFIYQTKDMIQKILKMVFYTTAFFILIHLYMRYKID